jgi:NADH:ubiquinone oxidoreductase subunit F (NADH-binding)
MRKITDFPKNKIAIEDLQDFMRVQNYAGLVELVSDLTGKGLISPIKSSGLNGKKTGSLSEIPHRSAI